MNTKSRSTILIVDDERANIALLAEALKHDFDLIAARSGLEAIDLALKNPPDLILLDVIMPEIDGYSVCRTLKGNSGTRDIPVIFITAKSEADDEVMGLDLGAVDYITKPFQMEIVRARIRTHIDLKRKYDLLERLVSLDGLTEIANRRRFDEALEQEWRRCLRYSRPVSVIMMDIDFFKQYNDCCGHAAGDDCLRRVACSLSGLLKRGGDLVARYGGEEFVALLPETGLEEAVKLAECLRKKVDGLKILHPGSSVSDHVTLSLGVATMAPRPNSTYQDLVNLADRMLYEAKRTGRNRVVWEGK